jgi:hypothetical protein
MDDEFFSDRYGTSPHILQMIGHIFLGDTHSLGKTPKILFALPQ